MGPSISLATLRPAVGLAVMGLLCVAAVAPAAEPPVASELDDEAFIETLEAAGPDDPVDRKRLSRLFFGIAATLEGGRTGVSLLQSAPSARLLTTETARALAAARFRDYAEAVERFRAGASGLLDRPDSVARLHQTLLGGHHACWRLEEYARLMQRYGVRASDLVSILSSTEACARFRRAAFQDCVERLVARELTAADDLREELHGVTVELEELERLLEDLRRIDDGE
jgi:hypothetical protein